MYYKCSASWVKYIENIFLLSLKSQRTLVTPPKTDVLLPSHFTVHTLLVFVLAYLATQDVNVVLVDWSSVADQLYLTARRAVVPVGEFLAQVLDWLVQTAGVSLDKVHIVGHSLGAHIAGTVGEHLSVGNLSRITGKHPQSIVSSLKQW